MTIDDVEDRFPHECKTGYTYTEVVPWCEEQFGQFGVNWYRYGTDIAIDIVVGASFYDYYRFAREEDAMLFILRWG